MVRRVGAGRGYRRQGERGAAAVEFAIVVPLLLLLLFGIVDFGYLINRNAMLANAAREGVRLASLGASADQVTAAVTRSLPAMSTPVTVTVGCLQPDGTACASYAGDAEPGGTAVVTVEVDYRWVTPAGQVMLGDTTHLSETSQMRIE